MNNSAVYLSPATVEHADRVLALMTADICKSMALDPITTLAQAADFIQGRRSAQNWRFFICHPQHGIIGGVNFTLVSENSGPTALFSYWLGEAYQGAGHASRAVALLLAALRAEGVRRFLAQVYPHNLGSQKLLKRFGFHCDDPAVECKTHPGLVDFKLQD